MSAPIDLAVALARATSGAAAVRADPTLSTIVGLARESMPAFDHVAISMARPDGTLEARAFADPLALELGSLQDGGQDGPGRHCVEVDPVVRVEHARHEQRWPGFIPRAVALGVRSMLGVRVHADGHVLGALLLYSTSSDTIDDDDEQVAELVAAHVGTALDHSRRVDNLQGALESSRTIGLALGITMQRLDLDDAAAFAYLTRLSATSETKLRDLAASIVDEHHARLRAESEAADLSS